MDDCLFCKIISGEIPSQKAYEDEEILAFHDINPQAPVHVLIIPKQHIRSADALTEADDATLCRLFAAARRCFVAGFTSAAFICAFKAKGILAAAAIELPFMLSLLPLAALCCVSIMMSLDKERHGFRSVRSYCLLTISAMAVFAGSALCEGYCVVWLLSLIFN